VEAKKPAENIRDDAGPALQIRRYAWNARLPLSILTDHYKNLIERQIEATDKQIDALVYELYGLTEDEIRIVEGTRK